MLHSRLWCVSNFAGMPCGFTYAEAFAVDGQEHNKELYYERTIQTLEQQLIAFQSGLANGSPVFDMRLAEASENTPSQLEDNDDQEVAEYMKRCRYVSDQDLVSCVLCGHGAAHSYSCAGFLHMQTS